METQKPFAKLGLAMLLTGLCVASTKTQSASAYVTSRYKSRPEDTQNQPLKRQNPSNIGGYYSALARGADRSQYHARPLHTANQRGIPAEHRKREWVWVPERNMYLMVTPGARLPERPNQRPFGPLGIGQQPQIYTTRMANGQEMLTDYFGHRYRAPKVLGMVD